MFLASGIDAQDFRTKRPGKDGHCDIGASATVFSDYPLHDFSINHDKENRLQK